MILSKRILKGIIKNINDAEEYLIKELSLRCEECGNYSVIKKDEYETLKGNCSHCLKCDMDIKIKHKGLMIRHELEEMTK